MVGCWRECDQQKIHECDCTQVHSSTMYIVHIHSTVERHDSTYMYIAHGHVDSKKYLVQVRTVLSLESLPASIFRLGRNDTS